MKKYYLSIFSVLLGGSLIAQTDAYNQAVQGASKMTTSVYEQVSGTATSVINPNQVNQNNIRRSNAAVVVGKTKYDLQTNASVARRVILHADGTVSMVWTTAPDDAFAQRGAGYYYVSATGGDWFNPTPITTTRLESVRTGWPQIGVLANGNEFTLGHLASDGGWARAENSGKGTAFTQTSASTNDDGPWKPIWGRMANVGDTVHLISSYTDSSEAGELRAKTINGVFAAMTYSRSLDGGKTWDIQHITLPEYDSTRYNSGGGDQYSIDANKNVVAITTTDLFEDMAYWKSTDYGLTFTKVIVDSFDYAPYDNDLMLDTPIVQDGSTSILVDDNGNVHLAWGLARIFDGDSTDEFFTQFLGVTGLAYWNEVDQNIQVIASSADMDLNGDGILTFSPGNMRNLNNGNLPDGFNHVARTGRTGLITMPSIGMDTAGRVFVSFSCINEQAIDPIWSLNLRDAFIVMSPDGGTTWNDPLNVTNLNTKEVAFPSIAKNVDAFVHMQFQTDDIPGTNLQNNSAAINNHPVVDNDISYMAIPVQQIIDANVDDVSLGVNNIAESKVFVVSQNSPNPFSGSTDITIYLNNPSALAVTITNIAGQTVQSYKTTELPSGNSIVTIDGSKLEAGVYMYSLSASNGETVTRKMIVK